MKKEGLIEIPGDIIILEVVEEAAAGKEEVVKILSLADVPDDAAAQMKEGIAYVKRQQANGNDINASGNYGFYRGKDRETYVHYRVTLRNSWGARNFSF